MFKNFSDREISRSRPAPRVSSNIVLESPEMTTSASALSADAEADRTTRVRNPSVFTAARTVRSAADASFTPAVAEQDEDTITVAQTTEPSVANQYRLSVDELPPVPRHHRQSPRVSLKARRPNKKRAAVLADRIAKAEAKARKKTTKQTDYFCITCNISCNSSKTLDDHVNSRRHRNALQNQNSNLFCNVCKRTFMCHQDLAAHNISAAHLKELQKTSQ